MFIPGENVAQVSMSFSQADGSFAENVFYVKASDAWDETSLTSIAYAFIVWWQAGDAGTGVPQSLTSHDTSLIAVTARDLTTQTGAVVVNTEGLPAAGVSTDASIALGLTWAITARTGLAGRSQRGRTFIIGAASSILSDSVVNGVDATQASYWVSAMNALIADVAALSLSNAPLALVVASRYHNGAPRDAISTTPITVYGYHNLLLDFQRRRAPAHNRHH